MQHRHTSIPKATDYKCIPFRMISHQLAFHTLSRSSEYLGVVSEKRQGGDVALISNPPARPDVILTIESSFVETILMWSGDRNQVFHLPSFSLFCH
jgi:hypothetical protein